MTLARRLTVITLALITALLGLAVLAPATRAVMPSDGVPQDAAMGTQPPAALSVSDVSLMQAHVALEAAYEKAKSMNLAMDVAIVDAGGNLKAFIRMDGAWLGSIDIAIKKARTARYFDMPTGEIGKLSQPGGPLYNIEHSNGGLITFPGGLPIKNAQGQVIGAVGVSGSTVENDHTVAQAAVDALAK